MSARRPSPPLAMLAAALLAGSAGGQEPIVLDGRFDDWRDVPLAVQDEALETRPEIDFGAVRVAHDSTHLYVDVELGNTVNAQGLNGTALLLLDVDGDEATGTGRHGLAGTDLAVVLTPPADGMGVGLVRTARGGDRALSPYALDVTMAPTHAGPRLELGLLRGAALARAAGVEPGATIRLRLAYLDANGVRRDATDTIEHALDAGAARPAPAEDPIAARAAGELRLVSWNGERGAMLKERERFARVLRALAPDVVAVQELRSSQSGPALAAMLDEAMPLEGGRGWQVVFGTAGGNLRCAVASRHPLERLEALDGVRRRDESSRAVRAAGGVVVHGGRRVLVASVHLKCCGRLNSREDHVRLAETAALNAAVREAARAARADAIVVAGDLNLVGGPAPLQRLRRGLDRGSADLAVAEPLQLDGRTNATWSDPDEPVQRAFTPGRLDYVLYTGSALELRRAFALDAADLPAAWLARHGLGPDDTRRASDHVPVVVDWRAP